MTQAAQVPEKMRKGILITLLATVLLSVVLTFFGAQGYFERQTAERAHNRMVLYQRALNEALRQHQHLPFVLAQDQRFAAVLDDPALVPDVNEALRILAQEAKLEAIYLMDRSGLVLASSNAGVPNSFLGQNYSFRPYFQEALNGARSDYFAIGATSGRPGYFVAEPVRSGSGPAKGVFAIKLDISELQRSWETSNEIVLAVNPENIVVLASDPDWLYRPTTALTNAERAAIVDSRQFGALELAPLRYKTLGENRIALDGTPFTVASGAADWQGWTVHYLQPEAAIYRQTFVATALLGSLIAILVGFATYLRSRRIELAYAASEQRRRELLKTNKQLEKAQIELARSAQLAALGQLAASVTHELGQPISAFRNHLAAAEISGEITSAQTAANLNKLVERMEAVTRQIRFFARARAEVKTRVSIATVLEETAQMLSTELADVGFSVALPESDENLQVAGNQIQLEQVFTNLLKNALHAVENTDTPEIGITVTPQADMLHIRVCDNGTGLGDAKLADLQEPFFSTKPSGVGMGLGLAIATEIIRDHGGTLSLGEASTGAIFEVSLPIWQDHTGESA